MGISRKGVGDVTITAAQIVALIHLISVRFASGLKPGPAQEIAREILAAFEQEDSKGKVYLVQALSDVRGVSVCVIHSKTGLPAPAGNADLFALSEQRERIEGLIERERFSAPLPTCKAM